MPAAQNWTRMLAALQRSGNRLVDVQGAYDADPAATGIDEIMACYPGVLLIVVYRLAHRLKLERADICPEC